MACGAGARHDAARAGVRSHDDLRQRPRLLHDDCDHRVLGRTTGACLGRDWTRRDHEGAGGDSHTARDPRATRPPDRASAAAPLPTHRPRRICARRTSLVYRGVGAHARFPALRVCAGDVRARDDDAVSSHRAVLVLSPDHPGRCIPLGRPRAGAVERVALGVARPSRQRARPGHDAARVLGAGAAALLFAQPVEAAAVCPAAHAGVRDRCRAPSYASGERAGRRHRRRPTRVHRRRRDPWPRARIAHALAPRTDQSHTRGTERDPIGGARAGYRAAGLRRAGLACRTTGAAATGARRDWLRLGRGQCAPCVVAIARGRGRGSLIGDARSGNPEHRWRFGRRRGRRRLSHVIAVLFTTRRSRIHRTRARTHQQLHRRPLRAISSASRLAPLAGRCLARAAGALQSAHRLRRAGERRAHPRGARATPLAPHSRGNTRPTDHVRHLRAR